MVSIQRLTVGVLLNEHLYSATPPEQNYVEWSHVLATR